MRETKAHIQAHRDELQEFADALRADLDRHRRALEAGHRRYRREQLRARHGQERILQQANQRAEQLELAGQELALEKLRADTDSMKAHKIMHQARLRADKLAAKLLLRANELGRERAAWVGHIANRERALDNANKRARGLQESLRKSKAQTAAARAEAAQLRGELDRTWLQVLDLRQKLRTANSAVLIGSLGGGLEIQPVSGRPFEDTSGYGRAALRAAKGIQ